MKPGFHKPNVFSALTLFGIAAMAGSLIFFAKNERPAPEPVPAHGAGQAVPNQEFEKFRLTGFDDKGKKFWNLEGDVAKVDPGQTIFLDQNVTLRLKDDTVIRTDRVRWSQDGGTLTTDADVFVDHRNAKIKGVGVLGRPSESFIQLNRNIEMDLNTTTRLTCSGPLKIFYKENKMVFYRNVRIVDSRGILTAKRMEVFFDADQRQIQQIFASGDVVIRRGTDTTRSQRAIYTVATGAVRLEGNPEITMHKSSSAILDGTFRN